VRFSVFICFLLERSTPVFNSTVQPAGSAPVYIVNGIGGCREGNSGGIEPQNAPAWRVVGYERDPGTTQDNNLFGFGVLSINATALTWTMFADDIVAPIDVFTMAPRVIK
jgi:hypothetical protein